MGIKYINISSKLKAYVIFTQTTFYWSLVWGSYIPFFPIVQLSDEIFSHGNAMGFVYPSVLPVAKEISVLSRKRQNQMPLVTVSCNTEKHA